MEFWKEVRRRVLTKEISKRATRKEYGLGWHTLEKILAHAQHAPERAIEGLQLLLNDESHRENVAALAQRYAKHDRGHVYDRLADHVVNLVAR